MSYPNETKDKFIELRAKGFGLGTIAEQLGISKAGAWKWELKFSSQIKQLRAIELEAIQKRVLAGYEQELTYLAEELKRVQTILRGRDYGYVDTPQLYWYQGALLTRIDKKCAPMDIPEPDDEDISAPEVNESEQK